MANDAHRMPSAAKALIKRLGSVGFRRVEWLGTACGAQSGRKLCT